MLLEKYNASGNDFLITHTFQKKDFSEFAKKVCNRQSGVGADGFIALVPHETLNFEWLFYNSDGSIAEMCGNGSRATAHYAFQNGLAPQQMSFQTLAGEIGCFVDGDVVTTDLTPPKILQKDISEFGFNWWLINTGVPHLVSLRDDISDFSIEQAQELRYKYNANVNIAKVIGDEVHVRTYERGVENETLACGTGMAGCFYRAFSEDLIGDFANLKPKSGEELQIILKNGTLRFRGAVQKTFYTEFK
ncbi:diaminopimelate epimerase [Thiovulum sp. ES]|nr:diaminopimelate epimerase [Thiovulum sp. ES]